jgi:hypothetical protein
MSRIEYGLGRFGDRRLEKGGPSCTRRWWSSRVHVSGVWEERGRGNFNSTASFATIW